MIQDYNWYNSNRKQYLNSYTADLSEKKVKKMKHGYEHSTGVISTKFELVDLDNNHIIAAEFPDSFFKGKPDDYEPWNDYEAIKKLAQNLVSKNPDLTIGLYAHVSTFKADIPVVEETVISLK